MSIASRLTALVTVSALVLVLLCCVIVTHRDYTNRRDAVLLRAASAAVAEPGLVVDLRFERLPQLELISENVLITASPIKRVRVFSSAGKLLHQSAKPWASADSAPALATLRVGAAPLDQAIAQFTADSRPPEVPAALAFLPEEEIVLSVPVVSQVDPLQEGLSSASFARALLEPTTVTSLFVVGYVEIAISRASLLAETLPTLLACTGLGLLLVLSLWLLARSTTGRITRPLGELARLADDVAAGRRVEPLPVTGSGEVRHITEILNGIIAGMGRYKKAIDVDRKMLNLKVDRRDEELSKQRQELDKAKEKVSATEERLRHLAYFDMLTGLPNRRLFSEQLSLLLRLAIRNGERLALVVLDVDHFKRINDSLGTEGGDLLLREVALRLEKSIRSSDVAHRSNEKEGLMDLSRMGGDEFAVVLNKLDNEAAAKQVASRIL